jgi:hypothetical protein
MKILFSLILLATALFCGFKAVPLWCIPLLAIPFTMGYIHGKWLLWQPLLQNRGKRFYQNLIVTYVIQCVVVLLIYLIGSGVARHVGEMR